MVTVEKVVEEGGVLTEADSVVPMLGESTLFLLTRTSPACLHLSPSSSFLTLSLPQIHGYQETKVSLLQK
jgi:hypothetical protein